MTGEEHRQEKERTFFKNIPQISDEKENRRYGGKMWEKKLQ